MECHQSVSTQTAQEVSVELRSIVTRRIQFIETKEECEPSSDSSSGDKTLSGDPGSHAPAGPDRMACPVKQCRSDQGTECWPGNRLQSDQGTKFCAGSRETSYTNQKTMMQNPSAQVITRSLSLGRMCQKLHPIPMSRNSRFILC